MIGKPVVFVITFDFDIIFRLFVGSFLSFAGVIGDDFYLYFLEPIIYLCLF